MIISELNNEKRKNILKKFYESFNTGYEFEEFLKPFLEKLGLVKKVETEDDKKSGLFGFLKF